MAKRRFSIGEALGDAFRMAGRRPLSVWVWGLIILLPVLAQLGFLAGLLLDLPFDTFADAVEHDDEDAFAESLTPLLVQMQLGDLLGLMIRVVGGAMVGAAVYRAILKPGAAARRPFGLGLGMAELRVGVTYVVIIIGLVVVIGCLALLILGVGLGAWPRLSETGQGWMVAVLPALLLLLMLAAYARVSLIPPSCIADEDFAFETGWRRAAGNTGRLVLMTLLLWLLVMVITVAAYAVLGLIGWGVWTGLGLGGDWPRDPASLRDILLHDPRILWLGGALLVPLTWLYGLQMVLAQVPYASAVRQLTPEPSADTAVSGDASDS